MFPAMFSQNQNSGIGLFNSFQPEVNTSNFMAQQPLGDGQLIQPSNFNGNIPQDLSGLSMMITTIADMVNQLIQQIMTSPELLQQPAGQQLGSQPTLNQSQPVNNTAPVSGPETVENNGFEAEVLRLTNEFRAQNGLPALQLDDRLNTAAQKHSQYMAQTGQLSHTGQNGSDPGTRIKAEGVAFRTAGENAAMGQRTPAEVVQGWINSPGHRKNLLNPDYQFMGLGREGNFWTQKFFG